MPQELRRGVGSWFDTSGAGLHNAISIASTTDRRVTVTAKRSATVLVLLFIAVWALNTRGKDVVSKAKYNAIQSGMSYNEVVEIIGKQGDENASSVVPGVSGVMPSINTQMYSWINWDGSNMNAMFQNGKLINKAQFGLK